MQGVVENVEEERKNEGSPANPHYHIDFGFVDGMFSPLIVFHLHFVIVYGQDQGQAIVNRGQVSLIRLCPLTDLI